MIKLKDILIERKVLSVFDFDDTLVKSDAWVYVLRNGRTIKKVTILTARKLGQPITSFLKTMDIDAYVVPLGSADPKLKANWIEDQIAKGYDTIYFMDDSNKNIAAVDTMLKRYPHIDSITKLIKKEK